ncbi:hypothetical protein [Photobacterium chitinilyticum]|uniref:Uncharacterized protein n=1 Tax=Photobacterium chitinilyticum TaxID=2485123 RepID=A0A444JJH9_9GAMM|nr:hypothetical protein [Photobacterium chitinilyticum]RWX53222.1 hypothetical protein EDI28_23310 [Photobacterium chitinilyticum]
MSVKTRYITTDLDIFSNQDLSELAAFFQERTYILHCGWRNEDLFHLCLEPKTDAGSRLDKDLDNLLGAVEQLPDRLKVPTASGKAEWYSERNDISRRVIME